jgi:NAD(P)-dependent dehydrogenase (short-subunit alcohol dehydrogenase family)
VKLEDAVVVVTGGAGGLGAAVCRRFAQDGAKVAVIDQDPDGCDRVAAEVGGLAVTADVTREADVQRLVQTVERQLGPVDVFHSNAGGGGGDLFADDDVWHDAWNLQVMASVYAARAVLPGMLERGRGHLVGTASGAALTAEPGDAAYSVTKHAMLDLYEVLSIRYGGRGIGVSCFCPFGMLTPMLLSELEATDSASAVIGMKGAVTPAFAADVVVDGVREDRFLLLSHPEALTYFRRKADDYDRWLSGMRRAYSPPST